MASANFHDDLISLLPKLKMQALALTRNRAAAEDLVQDAVMNALSAQASFTPGTNFGAWMRCILRNRFVSGLRKRHETADIDKVPEAALSCGASQDLRLELQELGKAVDELPEEQREALFLVVLHGMSYEEVAAATNVAVGTAKSRVFRSRQRLEATLLGTISEAAAPAPANRPAALATPAKRPAALAAPARRAGPALLSRAAKAAATARAASPSPG